MVNRTFGNTPGLVRQYGWCTSNGDQMMDREDYPLKAYLVLERGLDFRLHDWTKHESGMAAIRLRLLRDLLNGIATIHAEGWIHRDVTPQNILLFKARPEQSQPARAALCDFGKLCLRKTNTNTALAAWDFLPPEIVQGQSNVYDQCIDIWMLALALVLVWYPQAAQNISRMQNHQLFASSIEQIQARLPKEDSGLPELLRTMLAVKVQNRPSAIEALESPCFRNLDVKSAKFSKTSTGERPYQEGEDDEGLHTYESQVL